MLTHFITADSVFGFSRGENVSPWKDKFGYNFAEPESVEEYS